MSIKSEPKLPGWQIAGRQARNLFVHKGFVTALDAVKHVERKPTEKDIPLTPYTNKKFAPWQKELATQVHMGQHVIVDVTTSCGKTWATNLIVSHEVLSRSNATVIIVTPNIEVMRECIHDISVNHTKRYRYPTTKMLDSTSRNFMSYNEKRPPIAQIMIISVENFVEFLTDTINEEFVRRLKYIVFDEVHLPPISAGLWWSQFIPQCAQLILLSATIGNCDFVVSLVGKLNNTYPGRPRLVKTIKWDVRPISLQYVLFRGVPQSTLTKAVGKLKIEKQQNYIPDTDSSEDSEDSDGSSSEEEEEEEEDPMTGFAPAKYVRAGRLDLIFNSKCPTARDLKSLDVNLTIPPGREAQHALSKVLIPKYLPHIREKLSLSLRDAVVEPSAYNIYELLSYLFSNEMQPVMLFHGTTSGAHQLCDKLVGHMENLERKDPEWIKNNKLKRQYEVEQETFRNKQHDKKKKTRRDSDEEPAGKADDWSTPLPESKSQIDINAVLKGLQKWKFPSSITKIPENIPAWIKTALEYGMGVYVASMPQWLKHYMFDTFKQGHLKMFIADSSISVGINLPIRSVILCGEEELTQTLFDQVSGRAGRQGYETQGFVIPMFAKEKIIPYILAESKETNIDLPVAMTYSDLVRLNVPQNLDTYYIGDTFDTVQTQVSPYKQGILTTYTRSLAIEDIEKYKEQLALIKTEQWHYHRLSNVIKVLPGNVNILFMRVLVTGVLHDFTIDEFIDFLATLFHRHETGPASDLYLPPFSHCPDLRKHLQIYGDKYAVQIDFAKPIQNYFQKFCKEGTVDSLYLEDVLALGEWLYNFKNEVTKIAPATDKFRLLVEKTDVKYMLAKKRIS
jgi:hypothetical protein